jgi:hypothetical protein
VAAPRQGNSWLVISVGWMAAFAAVTATLVSSPDYRSLLRISLVSSIVALVCAFFGFRAGGWLRFEAILIALAACYVLFDFVVRAPGTFR